MVPFRVVDLRTTILCLLFLTGLWQSSLYGGGQISAEDIIQKAIERASAARAGTNVSDYTYKKVNVTEQLDSNGNVKERKKRTFQVFYRDGTTQVKLVEVNGH